MDLETLQEMKYSQLLKLAHKLEIDLQNQSKRKEPLIQAIMSFYNCKKDQNQCGKEQENKENELNEDEEVPKKKVKKVKKVKKIKKTEQNLPADEPDIDPLNQTMTRSRVQALNNQTLNKTSQLNELDTKEEEDEEKPEEKKSKKTKKSQKENYEEIIETKYEIREDGKKVKKIKRIKKKVVKENEPEFVEEKQDETKVKKIKKIKKKPQPENVENVQVDKIEIIPDKQVQTEINLEPEKVKNLSDNLEKEEEEQNEFRLELEDEENEVLDKKQENIQVIKEDKIESTETQDLNSSLLTNDEDPRSESKLENPEITRDILNTTFEKKDDGLTCTSFYSKKNDISDKLEEKQEEPVIEVKNEDENSKPKIGGARIVRPKQTVTVLQTIKTAKNETVVEEVKKVVEVINREAGPRIVKPTNIESDTETKKKNPKIDTKKKEVITRRAAPAPDFKAIHEKETQKMESIDSYMNRKNERFNKLNDKPSPNVDDKIKPKTPTIMSKPSSLFSRKTPLKSDTTPKFAKNILSNIPKLLKRDDKKEVVNEKKIESESVEPKTPEAIDHEKKFKVLKTPSSVSRPTESSLMKSNMKRNPSLKINLNDPNSLASIPPQLQSSSFVRRKSYDLNRSLNKPLGYNPHHGKLKKIDFNTKSVFLASLATGNNLNESKCGDKSILKANESILNANANPRRISTIAGKVKSENAGVCGDKNMLTDYIKSDKLKAITDKSTQMVKKLRMEKVKSHKQAKTDQHRKLDNLENYENEPHDV